jgi:hypothetical protein
VEQLPRGRHSESHYRPARSRRPAPVRPARARGGWVAGLGVVAVLAAAGVAMSHSDTRQPSRLSAASASVPLMGSSITSTGNLAQATAAFGRMPIVRVYYPGLPAANAWTTGEAAANRSAVIVSFKALPSAILSGADDAVLSHFFDTAPTGHPIYYSYYHEPEDNIALGEFTLADYKAAWARVVYLADRAHNPDIRSTLILMEWDLQKASGRNWKDYLPGDGLISTLGWDAYPMGSANNINPQIQSAAAFMAPAVAASKSVGLPYGFAEFGLSTPNGRPGWLAGIGNYLLNSGAEFATYFNGCAQYPTLQLTDPSSIAIWKSFVAKSTSDVPVPEPVPSTHSSSPAPKPSPSTSSPAPSASPTPPVSPSPWPSTSSPTPSASPTPPAPSPTPSANDWLTRLAMSPAMLAVGGGHHTDIKFTLSQKADITVVILNSHATVVREITRPDHTARDVSIPYYGFDGSGKYLAAGKYTVLVVASNAQGSSTAETSLTISG